MDFKQRKYIKITLFNFKDFICQIYSKKIKYNYYSKNILDDNRIQYGDDNKLKTIFEKIAIF